MRFNLSGCLADARLIRYPTQRVLVSVLLSATLFIIGTPHAQTPSPFSYGDIPLDPAEYNRLLREPLDTAIEALPAAYDARAEGIVTPAKDQGSCGSCWAFASVGALESHLLKALGIGPEDLSEQQQVSCNTEMLGCSGGNSNALRF